MNEDLTLADGLFDVATLGDTLDQPFKSMTTKHANAKPGIWRDLYEKTIPANLSSVTRSVLKKPPKQIKVIPATVRRSLQVQKRKLIKANEMS